MQTHRFVPTFAERCFRYAKNDVDLKSNYVVSLRTQTQKYRHNFHCVYIFGEDEWT